MLSEKLKGALVTAGPALAPSTLNCTLVVPVEALAVTAIVPETVAPAAGEVMEMLADAGGAGFWTLGLVTAAQPAASSASTTIKHNQGASPGWPLDLHMSLVSKLIESFLAFFEKPFRWRWPHARGFPAYLQASPRGGIPLLNRRSVLVQGATRVGGFLRQGGDRVCFDGSIDHLVHKTTARFLDRVCGGRLHLLIRKRLRKRPVEGRLLVRAAWRATRWVKLRGRAKRS